MNPQRPASALLTVALLFGSPPAQNVLAEHRADWLRAARWGVMTHYLPDWIEPDRPWTSEEWNALVDGFDVEALARQLQDLGAGYYLLTIGQNSGFYLSPNATYDRYVGVRPSRCSKRDLVADVQEALARRGIPLLVYLPSGPPAKDPVARKGLGFEGDGQRNREFQTRWEAIIREWALRWGPKVAGFWFDGCYRPNTMYRFPEPPNFASFAAAARAGNPDRILAFNHGVFHPILSLTGHEDYTAGEVNDLERDLVKSRWREGRVDGAQLHVLSYLGRTWGRGGPRFTAEQAAGYTRKVRGVGGVVTWDVPVRRNGVMAAEFVDRLRAVAAAAAAGE